MENVKTALLTLGQAHSRILDRRRRRGRDADGLSRSDEGGQVTTWPAANSSLSGARAKLRQSKG